MAACDEAEACEAAIDDVLAICRKARGIKRTWRGAGGRASRGGALAL